MWKIALSGAGTVIPYEIFLPMFTMALGQNQHGVEGASEDVSAAGGLRGKIALGYADENAIGAVSQEGLNVVAWYPDSACAVGIVIASEIHFDFIDSHGLHRSRGIIGN